MKFADMDKEALKVERLRLEFEESKARSDWMNHGISTPMKERAQRDSDLCEIRYLLGRMENEGYKKRRDDLLTAVMAKLNTIGLGHVVDEVLAEQKQKEKAAKAAPAAAGAAHA